MLVVAAELREFSRIGENSQRIRGLCWTPYVADAILAGVAGLFNPAGLFYVIASALPSTLGANAGVLWLPAMLRPPRPPKEVAIASIQRSVGRIIAAVLACLLFIVLLGRGLTWSR